MINTIHFKHKQSLCASGRRETMCFVKLEKELKVLRGSGAEVGENTAVCVRDFMHRLYMHLFRSTVCVISA